MSGRLLRSAGRAYVCVGEKVDAGGFGPKLESWAFALDKAGLEALMEDAVFQTRTCKLCK